MMMLSLIHIYRSFRKLSIDITPEQWTVLYYLWSRDGLVEYELSKVDFYLDINHYDKLPEIYGYVTQNQLPLLTFDNTQAPNQSYQAIFSHENPELMVNAINQLVAKRISEKEESGC